MKTISFFADLKTSMNADIPCFRNDTPKKGELRLSEQWGIVLPAHVSPQVAEAVKGLTAFLKASDITLRKGHIEAADTITIMHAPQKAAESYRIRTAQRSVRIEGDDSGIMYALFHLEDIMRTRGAPILPLGTIAKKPLLTTRILRSPMAFFYADEFTRVKTAYPDNYLRKMAYQGFNAVWLRGKLADLAKVEVFPEFGAGSEEKIAGLNDLVTRAARFGIKVFIYFNEPLFKREDDPFFKKYPQVKGEPHAPEKAAALCTSTPEVKSFLRDGIKYVFTKVPGLGGVILITASEHHTHCYSHFSTRANQFGGTRPAMQCPRCRDRKPEDVIGELVSLINEGVRSANPNAQVIVWNWSWSMFYDDPQSEMIRSLPKDVIVMGDFDRGSKRVTDGFEHLIDEYSLTFVGPADRFIGTAREAKSGGREIFAKLQVGTTHEIGSVPYFPLYRNIAEKFIRAKKHGVTGAMECWNFGNILSPNTELANAFSWDPLPESIDAYLSSFAAKEFGVKASSSFVKAWGHFDRAATHYPFSIPFLYWGPMHFGPAYPLSFEKNGKPAPVAWLLPQEIDYDMDHELMKRVDFGDDIESYRGPFTPENLIACLRNFCDDWADGLALIRKAGVNVPAALKSNYVREYTVSAAVHSQILTAANVTEFIVTRNRYLESNDAKTKRGLLSRMAALARDEIANAKFCRTLAVKNTMLGFHGEAYGYDYTPKKIDAKILTTQATLSKIVNTRKTLRRAAN